MPSPHPRYYLHPTVRLTSSGLNAYPEKVRFDLCISLTIDGLMTEWCGTLEPDSKLSMRGLAKLLAPPSQAFLYTCTCGDPGCGGFTKPVRSETHKTEFSEYIRLDDFRFHFRTYRGELKATPETVYFLKRDVRDLVSNIALTVHNLATKHPGQLSGQYDEDLRDFISDFLGQEASTSYAEPGS